MSAELSRQTPGESRQPPSETSFGRLLLRSIVFVAFQGALLFVAAGRLDWWMAWLFLGIMLIVSLASYPGLTPDLIEERTHVAENVPAWDRRLSLVMGPFMFGVLVVAGLDARFGWSVVPLGLVLAGAVLVMLGYGLSIWAMLRNPFFGRFVRIQHDRGQTVASGGPYRLIRHPSNLGMVIFHLAMALLLGSWWALIPAVVVAVCIVIRTVLEDRLLLAELEGYPDYAARVRYRLLPGIW